VYQKIAILITVLLAPLIVTSGLIDSTKIQKNFEHLYRNIFPLDWGTSEWFHFLFVFILISLFIAGSWIFLTWRYRRKNILKWFKNLPPQKKLWVKDRGRRCEALY
jgi:thiosulfate reductase cytochrome b subunit